MSSNQFKNSEEHIVKMAVEEANSGVTVTGRYYENIPGLVRYAIETGNVKKSLVTPDGFISDSEYGKETDYPAVYSPSMLTVHGHGFAVYSMLLHAIYGFIKTVIDAVPDDFIDIGVTHYGVRAFPLEDGNAMVAVYLHGNFGENLPKASIVLAELIASPGGARAFKASAQTLLEHTMGAESDASEDADKIIKRIIDSLKEREDDTEENDETKH